MSKGRRTFNLQDEEQMQQYRLLIGVKNARRKGQRVEEDKEHSSSNRDMRDTSENLR